ncbi:MAG: ATP-binding protein [Prevotellaceae bacterium]|nr:ATP-binding protein [Prevotellaceae bacterium]
MKNELNPFLTENYISKKYFCDREKELKIIKQKLENGNNLTLISNRRLGKTALIYRVFEEFEEQNSVGIFVDIFACTNVKNFTEGLALAIFKRFPEKKGIGKRFVELLKGLRSTISYDQLTGQPEIRFDYQTPKTYEHTIESLLQFIDNQNIKVFMAIDEFQQIGIFPEKNVEAVLRTVIQTLKNTNFIFSGSKKSMMLEMFNSAQRPFFASTQITGLEEIPFEKYKNFIIQKFTERKRTIDENAVDFILEWTMRHTYYTQVVCNSVFAECKKHADIEHVKLICEAQLTIQQTTFMQYRDLLGHVQWKMLIAIAKEGIIYEPQAKAFLLKHKIGAASSAKKALNALIDKEMVCAIETFEKTSYRVYNIFLMRWLERVFR